MSVYFVPQKGWRYNFILKGKRYTKAWFKTKGEAKRAEAAPVEAEPVEAEPEVEEAAPVETVAEKAEATEEGPVEPIPESARRDRMGRPKIRDAFGLRGLRQTVPDTEPAPKGEEVQEEPKEDTETYITPEGFIVKRARK